MSTRNLSWSQINSSSDEEEKWPRNRTLQSLNRTHFFSSSRTDRRPAEILNSGRYLPRFRNQQSRIRNFTFGESSRSDRSPEKMPIENDQDESDEDDDEWMCRDEEYDSDDLSLEIAKKSKWLKDFFGWIDSLTKDQIDDPYLLIHCPACKGGAGAVAWYRGFQNVILHAKNFRSKRVRLHRKFAEILDGELKDRRERTLVSNQEKITEWKGLGEEVEDDHLIVWPPMVIVQNTRSHRDEDGRWIGMGNPELLSCFKDYNIIKVKSCYGPSGHCGVSLLIFPSSAVGYLEAECLQKKFLREGRGKDEWKNHRSMHSSGDRLLYCYMATEGDMELFYSHAKGKQNPKFEMKSYKMMVVDTFKNMENNDLKLIELEKKVAMGTEENKILMETCDVINQKLRIREHEIQTIRRKASEELEECKNEIDYLDNYYADTIKQLTNNLEKDEMEGKETEKSFHMQPNCCNEPTSVA